VEKQKRQREGHFSDKKDVITTKMRRRQRSLCKNRKKKKTNGEKDRFQKYMGAKTNMGPQTKSNKGGQGGEEKNETRKEKTIESAKRQKTSKINKVEGRLSKGVRKEKN